MNARSPIFSTRVDEIAEDIFRISTPVPASVVPGGFTFNQYLVRDDEPLLFHTGPRMLFEAVREGIDRVMPVSKLRYVSFSHVEADECGTLNQFLAVAPQAVPLCGQIAAMVSIRRSRRQAAPRAGRSRASPAREACRAMARRAASAARMGVRIPGRVHHPHAVLRRLVHAVRGGAPCPHGKRHPRAERSRADGHGLLLPFAGQRPPARAPRRDGSHDARPHARPGVARRWRSAAAKPCPAARVDASSAITRRLVRWSTVSRRWNPSPRVHPGVGWVGRPRGHDVSGATHNLRSARRRVGRNCQAMGACAAVVAPLVNTCNSRRVSSAAMPVKSIVRCRSVTPGPRAAGT